VSSGLNPPTASFVNGTENENSSTPRNDHARPCRCAAGSVAVSERLRVATGAPYPRLRDSRS
jgi:hypothetical protein